jgi:hypothetical protein
VNAENCSLTPIFKKTMPLTFQMHNLSTPALRKDKGRSPQVPASKAQAQILNNLGIYYIRPAPFQSALDLALDGYVSSQDDVTNRQLASISGQSARPSAPQHHATIATGSWRRRNTALAATENYQHATCRRKSALAQLRLVTAIACNVKVSKHALSLRDSPRVASGLAHWYYPLVWPWIKHAPNDIMDVSPLGLSETGWPS